MKICYVFGGAFFQKKAASIQVAKMCQAFSDEGHKITLVVQEPFNKDNLVNQMRSLYGIRSEFRLCILRKSKWFPVTALIEAIRRRSQLVFTRNLYVAALCALKGFPTIFELHDILTLNRHVAALRFLKVVGRLPRFIVISKALMQDLFLAYPRIFDEENTFVQPDGVDLRSFEAVTETERTKLSASLGIRRTTQFIAGYAGNLYPGKGYEIILELAKRMPHVLFLVAGGPGHIVRIEETRARRIALGNLKFLGYLFGEMIPAFLTICDVLLLPNQTKVQPSGGSGDIGKYTSPLKLFEYMASGRPILASDLPILREVLNETNAILITHNQPNAWEAALRQIIDGEIISERIALKAKQDAIKYDWRQRVKAILASCGCAISDSQR